MLRLTFAFVSIFCLILFAEERPMVVGHKVISGREQASEERLMELYMALKEQVAGLDLAMTDREIKCLHGHRAAELSPKPMYGEIQFAKTKSNLSTTLYNHMLQNSNGTDELDFANQTVEDTKNYNCL